MVDDVKVILAEYRLALKNYAKNGKSKSRSTYIGTAIVALVFGIWVVRNLIHRKANDELIDRNRGFNL